MESISKRLLALNNSYNKSDEKWMLFVQDHKKLILENSNLINIPMTTMHKYTYRPEDYLRSQGYSPNLTWIILHINNIESQLYFKELDFIYIPDEIYMENLYKTFKNTTNIQ